MSSLIAVLLSGVHCLTHRLPLCVCVCVCVCACVCLCVVTHWGGWQFVIGLQTVRAEDEAVVLAERAIHQEQLRQFEAHYADAQVLAQQQQERCINDVH